MEGGSGEIKTGGCIASISGQGMAAAAAWDGKITIEEAWPLFKIGGGISVTSYKEQMNMETMELVIRSYTDQMGERVRIGAFGRPFMP